jgi:hypothetical protein
MLEQTVQWAILGPVEVLFFMCKKAPPLEHGNILKWLHPRGMAKMTQ